MFSRLLMWTSLVVIIVFILSQVVIPAFTGRRLFWIFNPKTKELVDALDERYDRVVEDHIKAVKSRDKEEENGIKV